MYYMYICKCKPTYVHIYNPLEAAAGRISSTYSPLYVYVYIYIHIYTYIYIHVHMYCRR